MHYCVFLTLLLLVYLCVPRVLAVTEFVKHYGAPGSAEQNNNGIPLSGGGWALLGQNQEAGWTAGDKDQ
jgi:hypothetical protein